MLHLCSLPDGFPLSGLDTRSGGRPASGGDPRARGGASQFTAPVPGWPRLPRRATPMAFGGTAGVSRGAQGAGPVAGYFFFGRYRSVMVPKSEEHTSELQSLMRISYAVFCLKKKKTTYRIQRVNPNDV